MLNEIIANPHDLSQALQIIEFLRFHLLLLVAIVIVHFILK